MTNHRTNHSIKAFVSLVFVLIIINFSLSQGPPPEWIVYNTSNSGLPSNNVLSIAIDGAGNKWIGTRGGLAKFDGSSWTVYNTSNSGLPDNWVFAIAIDGGGNKWIGTNGGLAKFDGVNWTVYNAYNSSLPSNGVLAIVIDGGGNKWIGTGGGLAKFDGSSWTVYNISNSGLPDNIVNAIAIDGAGNKWIGTLGGLAKFDGVNWTVYNTSSSGLPDNNVRAIAIDGAGNKWIGTWSGGLAKFDGVNWTVYNTSSSGLPDNNVRAIAIDGGGNKWIGTNGGLAKFDGSSWTVYNTSNSGLPNNYVRAIAIDGLENKWIGTDGGGLAVYRQGGVILQLPVLSAQKIFDNGGTSTTPGTVNYPVLKVRFTVSNDWAKISGLTVKKFVNVSDRTLADDGEVTLNVYNDANGNNTGELSELLGSASFSANSATVTFAEQMVTTTGLNILLTIDVPLSANSSRWVALKIESPSDVNVTSPADKSPANYPIKNENDISLPVQVASVLADVSGRDVRIKIKTQTERDDFLGFNVYRGKDGENFVIVGSYESVSSLRAKGNMAYGGEYEFVDKGLNSGSYQYKIEAVGKNEKKFVGDVISVEVGVPKGYALHQNYPNPFNPVTVIEFETPEAGYVLIELYNSVGWKVRDIFAGELPAGYHKVRFDASGLSSGVYFYRMKAGKFNAVKHMSLVK
jgi:hypothetical protein